MKSFTFLLGPRGQFQKLVSTFLADGLFLTKKGLSQNRLTPYGYLVPKGGFEPPRGSPTTPSRWRVYQFHHFGILFDSVESHFFGSGAGA